MVVPDLHARMELVLAVLADKDDQDVPAADRLASGQLQILFLGDGFHAEGRAVARWQVALEEFKGGYRKHSHMDAEMRESLGVMQMVMALKQHFPNHLHFLKGNHENITNEQGEGNYPFLKFANEGLMVRIYMEHFYGEEILRAVMRHPGLQLDKVVLSEITSLDNLVDEGILPARIHYLRRRFGEKKHNARFIKTFAHSKTMTVMWPRELTWVIVETTFDRCGGGAKK